MHVKYVIALRASGIHTSSLVLMTIIDILQRRHKSAYIGEMEAMYSKHSPDGEYQYKSIYSMLSRLIKRGHVKAERHGKYNSYDLTPKGYALAETFSGKA